jgi:hypothetical protein
MRVLVIGREALVARRSANSRLDCAKLASVDRIRLSGWEAPTRLAHLVAAAPTDPIRSA